MKVEEKPEVHVGRRVARRQAARRALILRLTVMVCIVLVAAAVLALWMAKRSPNKGPDSSNPGPDGISTEEQTPNEPENHSPAAMPEDEDPPEQNPPETENNPSEMEDNPPSQEENTPPQEEEQEPENIDYPGYSQAALDEAVGDVVNSIISDGMTNLEKARAIFDFTRTSIRYTGDSDKSYWKVGAFEGLVTRRGDCFTYYSVSRALLTAVGIDNLEVTRVGGPTSHYWNLVNCGDGWYHFDATPRSSKLPKFESFMFTDQEAADYTEKAGRNYFTFDGSLLPPRAGGEAEDAVSQPTAETKQDEASSVQQAAPSVEAVNPAVSGEMVPETQSGASSPAGETEEHAIPGIIIFDPNSGETEPEENPLAEEIPLFSESQE